MGFNAGLPNRRRGDRKPIDQMVRFKILESKGPAVTGLAKTLDMSSSGVLLATDQKLDVGKTIEVAISWPASLDNGTKLKFVARGTVVRSREGRTAVRIQQYEFRTMGAAGL